MFQTFFLLFSGIALTIAVSFALPAMLKKKYGIELIFGFFAFAAGIYYLLRGIADSESLLSAFFATAMFGLFPWYFAFETNFIKKKWLVLISVLCLVYFISVSGVLSAEYERLSRFVAYAVYLLTATYCIVGMINMGPQRNFTFIPFLLVSTYYTIFIIEEIAFDTYGYLLPWRSQSSVYYLDFFPLIIILNKLFLLVRDQWHKTNLEKSLLYYKENLNLVLEKAEKLVAALDTDGKIVYANDAFMDLMEEKGIELNRPFEYILEGEDREQFKKYVLKNEGERGSLIITHKTTIGNRTIAWSFIKQANQSASETPLQFFLFGSDITRLKRTEEDLRSAYKDLEVLKDKLQAENIQLRRETQTEQKDEKLIGESPLFHYVLNRIEDAAPLDIPVLLEGETGVGKELFANAIHEKSSRRHKPFIKVNCAAIPGELLESELFGYEKGAFTGAEKNKKGVFELADGGTLFLDEIGELPIALQPKLLRAIQEQQIKPLGAEKERPIDIRLLAATNRSLLAEVEKGNFRSDLYYRINVFPITIPPLRKRKEDIPLLVEWFVNFFNEKYSKNIMEVSGSLMDVLRRYPWPGNIRQLRNIVERAVITSSESVLKLAAPLPEPNVRTRTEFSQPNREGGQESVTLEEFERRFITQTLERCNWKISGKLSASEALDLPPSTLRSKMKKLGIQPG